MISYYISKTRKKKITIIKNKKIIKSSLPLQEVFLLGMILIGIFHSLKQDDEFVWVDKIL